MTLAADLVAQLAAAGTPPELLAAVAQELFAGEIERKALADRRENERQNSRRYRSRLGREIPGWLRQEVFERDDFKCVDCGAEDRLECDHVIPLMAGGTSDPDNLQTLCRPCNARKRDRIRKADKRGPSRNKSDGEDQLGKRGLSPKVSPKNNIQTPSSPPVDVSEAEASSHQPRPWALPAGVSFQVWQDFLANRKRKRLGSSQTAWKAFNDDLKRVSSQTGIPPPQLIEQCTAKGWGAIYDPRNQRDERSDPTTAALQRIIGAHC